MIGIAVLSVIAVTILGIVIVVSYTSIRTQWKTLRRKWRALQSGATHGQIFAKQYQELTTSGAWREPLDFEATTVCPHCGFLDTHMMTEPVPDRINLKAREDGTYRPVAYPPWVKTPPLGDHPEAATVRNCRVCGHVWGEK